MILRNGDHMEKKWGVLLGVFLLFPFLAEAQVVSGKSYRIITTCGTTSKVMSIANNSVSDAAAVVLATKDSTKASQVFTIEASGSAYKLTAKISGKVLDVAAASKSNSAPIIQYKFEGSANQLFVISSPSSGVYKFKSVNSGLFIDLPASKTVDGTAFIQYANGTGCNQRFKLEEVTGVSTSPAPAPAPAPTTETWTRCASEDGVCSFSGTHQVRYGLPGFYAYKTVASSVSCNNATFGDPAVGKDKFCDYSSVTSTAPAPSPSPTPAPTPVPPVSGNPTGQFYIVGKDIIDPSGNKFYPMGGNVGVQLAFDWKGVANNHSADAVAWGWNTVRLTLYCSDMASWTSKSQKGYAGLLAQADAIVSEYTGKKIVVMIECHDLTGDEIYTGPIAQQVDQFWTDMAIKYKNNPYVWFNAVNEPAWGDNASWVAIQKHYLDIVRKNGSENIFVADVMNMGQDAGWDGAKKVYDPSMGPQVASGKCNILFSLHAYGGLGGAAEYSSYIDSVQKANMALIVGEFGYTIDGSSTAGDYTSNKRGAEAIFSVAPAKGVGMLWWHATHGDSYSLKSSGGAFYDSGNSGGLSAAGTSFWKVSHSKPNLGAFAGKLAPSNCASAAGK
jgi:mannan endo-1,4-beta-mannosidase